MKKNLSLKNLFIKKSNLNMKIPVWNMTYENIKPHCHIDCYCAVFVPGCLGPLWTETLAQVASVGEKHQGSDENTPGENAANSLWTESLGRWPGKCG